MKETVENGKGSSWGTRQTDTQADGQRSRQISRHKEQNIGHNSTKCQPEVRHKRCDEMR